MTKNIKRMKDKEKIHQILSSLWKNDDSIGKTYYNQALQDVQTAIDLQEEPKKCMYALDDFNDEDRKVTCDGCEEDCKYAKLNAMLDDSLSKETKESWNERLGKEEPVSEEWIEELRTKLNSMSKEDFKKVFDKYAIDFNEEPVSDDLDKAAIAFSKQFG